MYTTLVIYFSILVISCVVVKLFSNKIVQVTAVFTIISTLYTFANDVVKSSEFKINPIVELIDDPNYSFNKIEIKGNDLYIDYIYQDSLDIRDYPAGKYSFKDYPIAKSIAGKALTNVSKFCNESQISTDAVMINIVGTADGIPTKVSYYKGDLGDDVIIHYLDEEGIYQYIHLQKGITLMTNKVYAACRAYCIQQLCEGYFGHNNPNINTILHCFKNVGPEYRKVTVSIKIKNFSNPMTKEIDKYFLKRSLRNAKQRI